MNSLEDLVKSLHDIIRKYEERDIIARSGNKSQIRHNTISNRRDLIFNLLGFRKLLTDTINRLKDICDEEDSEQDVE